MTLKPNLKFKNFRKSQGLTQIEFAKELGVSQGTVTDIERGRFGVSTSLEKKLKEKYGIEPGYFNSILQHENTALTQGNETGYTQGFDKLGINADDLKRAKSQAARIIKELKRQFPGDKINAEAIKLIEKQRVIAEKAISLMLEENADYQIFRKSMIAIYNFEDMLNNLTNSHEILKIISINIAGQEYIDKNNVSSMKAAIDKDFRRYKDFVSLLSDLANSMKIFVEKGKALSEITEIAAEEFDNYLELTS